MNEQYISVETSKVAKENKFNWPVASCYVEYLVDQVDPDYPEGGGSFSMVKGAIEIEHFYFVNGGAHDYSNKNYICFARTTQVQLQKWLREVHNIDLYVVPLKAFIDQPNKWIWKISRGHIEHSQSNSSADIFEKSFEQGLLFGLKLISIISNK